MAGRWRGAQASRAGQRGALARAGAAGHAQRPRIPAGPATGVAPWNLDGRRLGGHRMAGRPAPARQVAGRDRGVRGVPPRPSRPCSGTPGRDRQQQRVGRRRPGRLARGGSRPDAPAGSGDPCSARSAARRAVDRFCGAADPRRPRGREHPVRRRAGPAARRARRLPVLAACGLRPCRAGRGRPRLGRRAARARLVQTRRPAAT